MTLRPRPRLTLLTFALLCVPYIATARAQDASPWDKSSHAAARLLAGAVVKTPDATFVRAESRSSSNSGWKTYWRDPGNSGMPPSFSFAGSENVKSVSVLWPAPERFPDGADGFSIGYMGNVVLPLRVTPADVKHALTLRLKLNYAICANLCVPAEANLKLALDGRGAQESSLEQAELQVPRHLPLGVNKDGLAITSVHRETDGDHQRVVVEVAAPENAPVQLFVEGPSPDWALPLPQAAGPAAATRRFTFDLDHLPAGAQAKGSTLTFTAVAGDKAIEVPAHLD